MWIKRQKPIWYIGIYVMRRENHCYFNLLQCQCEDCSTNLCDLPKKKENFIFRSHSKLPVAPCIIDLFYQQYFFTWTWPTKLFSSRLKYIPIHLRTCIDMQTHAEHLKGRFVSDSVDYDPYWDRRGVAYWTFSWCCLCTLSETEATFRLLLFPYFPSITFWD